MTSQYAHSLHTGGRARPSRPQRIASSTPRPLGAPRAHLAWRLHSFVTNPHESCAPAAPRWVPVLPVRSRDSMPALGVGVERESKRIKDRKDSRYIFLFDQPQAARASRFVKQNLCAPIVGCIVVLAVPVIDSRANIVLLPIAVRSGRGLCECSRLRSHTDLT
jgi:hypothetical protein